VLLHLVECNRQTTTTSTTKWAVVDDDDDDDGFSSASDAGRESRARGWISGSGTWTAPVWLDFISVSGVVGVGDGVRRRERRGWVG
jgi:hypothetical protein